jgi:hypothetical protein
VDLKLLPNWRKVALNSWSFRINVVIAITSAVEAAVTYLVDGRVGVSIIVAGASIAASGARLVKQVTVSGEEE